MHNKAQGLPMNALVLGALALLVLIALTTMWVSGGGSIFAGFGQIIGGATPSTRSQARLSCQAACEDLKSAKPEWDGALSLSSYKYCKLTFDLSKELTGATAGKCYDEDGTGATQTSTLAIESCVLNGKTVDSSTGCKEVV